MIMLLDFLATVLGAMAGIFIAELLVGRLRTKTYLKPYVDDITSLRFQCLNLETKTEMLEEELLSLKANMQSMEQFK